MKKRMKGVILLLIPVLLTLIGCPNPLDHSPESYLDTPAAARSAGVLGAADSPLINEFVANHTGTDTHEFIEVFGSPNSDYSQYTVLEIEGDSYNAGIIDGVFPVGTTDPDGYWTTPFLSNEIENGTVTYLLVLDFSGTAGTDLDTDNDGTIDAGDLPWTSIVDSVAVHDNGSSDWTYTDVTLTRSFDGGSYTVGGASRIPNGTDTNSVSDWVRNDYDGEGLPGFNGTPEENEALNTPGARNVFASPTQPIEATIMEIQGTGTRSPLEGELISTTGVVTLLTADGKSFWMQDLIGDEDPATSDGIFVYRGCYVTDVEVGDLVTVTAKVKEYATSSRPTDLPLTELVSADEILVESQGVSVPVPVSLTRLPNEIIAEGITFWESLEGMLVSVEHAPVVGPTSKYGEFCIIARGNARPGSGFHPLTSQIVIRSLGYNEVDYNPERIIVDDSSLSEPIIAQPRDVVKSLTGVVDYNYSNYKIQPVEVDLHKKQRPDAPLNRRTGPRGNVRITTFNVENLFDLENNPEKDDKSSTPTPEELEIKLTKLTMAICEELLLPDILVAQEVENTEILQTLADRVNQQEGTNYVAVSFETSDGRGIEVGFLYDTNTVELLNAYQMFGPDVEAAFGPSSPSPGREPIVGVFSVRGKEITIIGNHFKSKGGDEPLFGANWPPVRITEIQRKAQARVVRDFVNELFAENLRALVVVTGDLNDFQFGEPGEGSDHPVGIIEGSWGEIPLINLVKFVRELDRFTYLYEGNSQVLDHMLISPLLLRYRVGVNILHFNASYPDYMKDDPSIVHRSSDHDAVELRLRLR